MRRQALDSLVVTGLSAVSLGTTVVLYRLVTHRFGPNETDAFFLAFGVLNVLIVPAYNAISSTLVPTLVRRSAERPDQVPLLLGAAVSWAACASLIATMVVAVFATEGTRLLVAGLPGATAELVGRDVLILGPLIMFQAVGAVIAAASQAGGRYWAPAAAVVFQQAATIALVAAGIPVLGDVVLPLAFTLGAFSYLLFLVLTWPWRRMRIVLSLERPTDLISSARLAVPLFYGTIALQLGLVGLRLFAAHLEPGTVTAFDLAYRVAVALVEVSASGVLAVALTQWSAAVVIGDVDSLRSRLRDTVTLVLFVILPLPVAFHALRVPLVHLWLSSSAASPGIVGMTIAALGILLLGVPLDVAGRLYARALIARERTGIVGWLALLRTVVTLILAAVLVSPLEIRGLALSDTTAILLTLLSLHRATTGHWVWAKEMTWRGGLPRLVIAASTSWIATSFVASTSKLPFAPLQCALGVGAALAVYVGTARLLKFPELAMAASVLKGAWPTPRLPYTPQ